MLMVTRRSWALSLGSSFLRGASRHAWDFLSSTEMFRREKQDQTQIHSSKEVILGDHWFQLCLTTYSICPNLAGTTAQELAMQEVGRNLLSKILFAPNNSQQSIKEIQMKDVPFLSYQEAQYTFYPV